MIITDPEGRGYNEGEARATEPATRQDPAMAPQSPGSPLSEERRREIFLALVEAQDDEMGVAQSRKAVAERFHVSENQVRQIEREGVDNDWPPLQ
jgi:hypothetical protein